MWASYEQAVIRLQAQGLPMLLRSAPSGIVQGAFPYEGPVHVVTAWNPAGRVLSLEANRALEQALVADPGLLGLKVHACTGGDLSGSHQEPSLMIEDLATDSALALGRRYGQDAIFRWTRTTLDLLTCAGGACITRGWTLGRQHAAVQTAGGLAGAAGTAGLARARRGPDPVSWTR